jgi:excisionase family DNA binding protein
MIWLTVVRAGTIISLAAAVLQLYDLSTREVKPNRIYSSREAARYLGVNRRTVVKLIHAGELKGKLIRGNYRIPGQSIMEYLNQ